MNPTIDSPDMIAAGLAVEAERLHNTIRNGKLTLDDARQIVRLIRETEGWLTSSRDLLDPEQPIE